MSRLILAMVAAALIATPMCAQGTLYGASRDLELFTIDTTTGAGTLVAVLAEPCGFGGSTEIEYDNGTGRAFSQASDGAFCGSEFDLFTGGSVGGAIPNGGSHTGIEVVSGTWYATVIFGPGGASELHTLDPFSGVSTNIGLTGVGPISGLAYDVFTGVMYGIAGGPGPADLHTIDLGSGVATVVGSTGIQAGSLQFGPFGQLWAGGTGPDAGMLFTIDPATGASSPVGPTGFGTVTGLTLEGQVVPVELQLFSVD